MTNISLPHKLEKIFDNAIKLYDQKEYHKSLEEIEEVLKKKPQHPESLSLKGLVLLEIDRKEEALEFCRKGLSLGITHFFTWQAYAIYNKKTKNYKESLKCYQRAYEKDQKNLSLLIELSNMQLLTRDFNGYLDSRKKLLKLQPNKKENWFAFSFANYLNKDYDMAIQTIEKYTTSNKIRNQNEMSEIAFYHNELIEISGNYEHCNEHLDNIFPFIKDKRRWKEKKARMLLILKKYIMAERMYYMLLDQNPSMNEYLDGIEQSKQIIPINAKREPWNFNEKQLKQLNELYSQLQKKYPKSLLINKRILEIKYSQNFKKAFIEYVIPQIKKGIPSMFSNLISFYQNLNIEKNMDRVKIIEQVMFDFVKRLEYVRIGKSDNDENNENDKNKKEEDSIINKKIEIEESRASLVYVYYYLTQHFDKLHQFEKAFEFLNKAIEHTPTLFDLYAFKGRLYKHVGDFDLASKCVEKTRKLDLADRHINNESTKYFLRNQQTKKGTEIFNIFMKDLQNFPNWRYFQVSWMTNEMGSAHLKKKEYSFALKMFQQTTKNYTAYYDNQLTYHQYCLKEGHLCSLMNLVNLTNKIYSYPFYLTAAKGVIEIYLYLHEQGAEFQKELITECEKLEKEINEKKKTDEQYLQLDDDEKKLVEDDDPVGKKLIETKKPLEEALKILQKLENQAGHSLDTHLLALKVYTKMGNYNSAIESIQKIRKVDPNNFQLHKLLVEFLLQAKNNKKDLNEKINTTINDLRKELNIQSLSEYNQQFLQKNINKLEHRVSVAEVMLLLGENKEKAIEIMMKVDDLEFENKRLLQSCLNILLKLQSIDENYAIQYREKYSEKFKYSTDFNPQILEIRKEKKIQKQLEFEKKIELEKEKLKEKEKEKENKNQNEKENEKEIQKKTEKEDEKEKDKENK
ncbi:n(alpha)-acetyltransferase 15/16 [Anaeramoeba flamelloides]|uniref:N(Alpha)-acetyltransferase 15/16 n=1 Tax=Anaeramoeba flamelloides TaxID=1746091 RepID=A0ABQ8YXY2_9EUKA|nr:n(alpha)-acetyltransferase 15/16 [Anaeramoeba flamelloides]